MTKFEEFNELLKSELQEIDYWRNGNPAKYWLGVYCCVNEQRQMMQDYIDKFVIPNTLQEVEHRKHFGMPLLPIHFAFDFQRDCLETPEDYVPKCLPYFYHHVHAIAHNQKELTEPKILTTSFLGLQDGIYMMMVTGDEHGIILEVFPPHFWNRYLYRVKHNSMDSSKLPNAKLFENDKVRPTFEQMIIGVGHFIGRNWVFTTTQNPMLFSKQKQRCIQDKDMATIFMDGYSWDDVFTSEEVPGCAVMIHKSFISWSELGEDQRDEVVQYKKQHLDKLMKEYPNCLLDFLAWMTE